MRHVLFAAGACLAALLAPAAQAADDAEIAEIRAQLKALKETYEARIGELEQRLQEAERRAAAPSSPAGGAAAAPVASAPAVPAATAPPAASPNAFNPAIYGVLQGHYAYLSQDPAQFAIRGFATPQEGPGRRGLSLAESELGFSASVDERFAGNLILSLSPNDSVAVEEAYGVYTAAPYGLVPKFGRFLSGLGYLNEQHQHTWDFVDAPLAYEAFLGGQYRHDGVQLKWVAPTEQFVELGAEIGGGDTFPGSNAGRNGVGATSLFAHAGGDVGDSHTWRAGLSWLHTRPEDRRHMLPGIAQDDAMLAFSGRSDTLIADFVWKWALHGNARTTSFKLQGEYFRRRERGDLAFDPDDALGLRGVAPYRATQSGFYVQGVWQFRPAWRVGARYDWLDAGSPDYGDNSERFASSPYNPKRLAAMVDWTPSEFSRFRLQFAQSKVRQDATDNQVFLQYILTIGAHGAHKY